MGVDKDLWLVDYNFFFTKKAHETTIGYKSHTFGSTNGLSQFYEANTKQVQYLEQIIKKGKIQ